MHQREPEASIREAQAAALAALPFDDVDDFAAAERGFIGTLDDPKVLGDKGEVVWMPRPTTSSRATRPTR